jgi:hypothetical protein
MTLARVAPNLPAQIPCALCRGLFGAELRAAPTRPGPAAEAFHRASLLFFQRVARANPPIAGTLKP